MNISILRAIPALALLSLLLLQIFLYPEWFGAPPTANLDCRGEEFVIVDLGRRCKLTHKLKQEVVSKCIVATSRSESCQPPQTLRNNNNTNLRCLVLDRSWHRHSCKASSCKLLDWTVSSHRTSAAVILAVASGATRITLLRDSSARVPITSIAADEFIPVLHVSGHHTVDPKCADHFSKEFLLTTNLERVSKRMTAVTYTMDSRRSPLASGTFAMGGKSLLNTSASSAVTFEEEALWAAIGGFCTGYPEAELLESLLLQSVLWKLRRNVAVQFSKRSESVIPDKTCQKELQSDSFADSLHRTQAVCDATAKECLLGTLSELSKYKLLGSEKCNMDLLKAFLNDLDEAGYLFPTIPKQKRFAYLVQGSSAQRPPGLNMSKDGDVFLLSWKNSSGLGVNDIFYPNSTFNEGRNALLRMALSLEIGRGWEYLVVMDDDARLNVTDKVEDALWEKDVPGDPYRRLERFLLRFRPAIATPFYSHWPQYSNKVPSGPFTKVRLFDPCFNAYHRQTLGFLLPFYETSMDPKSWWYEANLRWFMASSVYPDYAILHVNSLLVSNTRVHGGTNPGYPDGGQAKEVYEFIRRNFKQGMLTALDNVLENKIRSDPAGSKSLEDIKSFVVTDLDSAYPDLILNTTKMRITNDGPEPSYIVRDDVIERLVEGEELRTIFARWRKSPLLYYLADKSNLF